MKLVTLVITTTLLFSCAASPDVSPPESDDARRRTPRATEHSDALEFELELIDAVSTRAQVALTITNNSGHAASIPAPDSMTAGTVDDDGTVTAVRRIDMGDLGTVSYEVYAIAEDEVGHTTDRFYVRVSPAAVSLRICLEVQRVTAEVETGERAWTSGLDTDDDNITQLVCTDPTELA